MLCLSAAMTLHAQTLAVPDDLRQFVWPSQWSAVQEVHMVSGRFAGALQRGVIAYDFDHLMTREDQALISGPSVKTDFTSDNMTEWFRNTTWYYMDWTTGECQTTDFGWGQVRPDFLVRGDFPSTTGSTYIYAYSDGSMAGGPREYVNTSWVQTDGSAGFGSPPGSSIFEWYIDKAGKARRMRMPSSLASNLMIDLVGFESSLPADVFELPQACKDPGAVRAWAHGPVTPLASRFAAVTIGGGAGAQARQTLNV